MAAKTSWIKIRISEILLKIQLYGYLVLGNQVLLVVSWVAIFFFLFYNLKVPEENDYLIVRILCSLWIAQFAIVFCILVILLFVGLAKLLVTYFLQDPHLIVCLEQDLAPPDATIAWWEKKGYFQRSAIYEWCAVEGNAMALSYRISTLQFEKITFVKEMFVDICCTNFGVSEDVVREIIIDYMENIHLGEHCEASLRLLMAAWERHKLKSK